MKIVFISDACLPSPSAEALFVVRMAQAREYVGGAEAVPKYFTDGRGVCTVPDRYLIS